MLPDLDRDAFTRALAKLPLLRAVEWRPSQAGSATVQLALTTPNGTRALEVHRLAGDVTSAAVDRLAAAGAAPRDHIVLARHIPPGPGERLGMAGWNYLDTAGNCRICLDETYFWFVEGRRPTVRRTRQSARGDLEATVLFTLLAEPELCAASPDAIAARSGVPTSVVRPFLRRFLAARLPRPAAVQQWLAAYEGGLRVRLTLGTFRPRDPHPEALEPLLREALQGRRWAFGGGWANQTMTGHYRGPLCVVHVDELPVEVPRVLRALPDERGSLVFVRPPSALGYEGKAPGIAHPLLVYSELMMGENDRAHEAADEVGARFLHLAA